MRLYRAGRSLRSRAFERAVSRAHDIERAGRVDVTDDRQNRIRRPVEVPVELHEGVAIELAQPRLVADSPPPHAVPVVQNLVQGLHCERGGIVRFPLRLLDYHLELLRELRRIDY